MDVKKLKPCDINTLPYAGSNLSYFHSSYVGEFHNVGTGQATELKLRRYEL